MMMLIFFENRLVTSLSPIQQKSALFQFQQSMTLTTPHSCSPYPDENLIPSHPKTMSWNMSSDYCTWEGVTCQHETGDVIGLDLSCSQLEGAIRSNSTLFQLSHLQFLNLSHNNFSLSNQLPQEFGFFAKGLTHLNLSSTGFRGRVPSGISHLYKLVSLDLSDNYYKVLEGQVFKSLLQNLTQLRVLNLDFVGISSVFPINISTSLRVIIVEDYNLQGVLPQEVFHLPNLEVLNIYSIFGNNLTATLPKVKWGSSGTLQDLYLGEINIDGGIPDSVGMLESLTSLGVSNCNVSGPIPSSIGNLDQLTYLDLDGNNLNGPIATLLASLTNLRFLRLSNNNFSGPLPSWVSSLTNLSRLHLYNNSLSGSLPPWLFDHPSLKYLDLGYNRFTGQLYGFDPSKSKLEFFFCNNNLLHGPIPQSFSQFVNLTLLVCSSNNFSGVLDIKIFSGLEYLERLDLSENNLTVRSTSTATLPSKLTDLSLSSCNMKEFPHFSRDARISLSSVDLSNNDIHGQIPHWIGSVSWYLNISRNRLTGGLELLPWNMIQILDLQSNMLNGSLPNLICNSSSLVILNLSNNNLSGVLPICPKNLTSLRVFDLRRNNIKGNLPSTLSNFQNLQSLNLHGNKLDGRIPSSFAEFGQLETLDLGSNQINDTFPQCLESLPNLQVLVLKSNKFYGLINKISKVKQPFPRLRIIDLSYNEFSGPLPVTYFKNFKAMINVDDNRTDATYMGYDGGLVFYKDSMALVIKGVEIEMVRILTVLTAIDVSRNKFEGDIPGNIGNLVSLRYLNLSHNLLTGNIPFLIGKLSILESLDLSSNGLQGEIPQQLTNIYTLAHLNLSCNQLSGHIPQGPQFNTFDKDSYVGNIGLCGLPLSTKCENYIGPQEEEDDEDDDHFFSGFTWEAVVVGYGCGVVPAFIIGYLMLLA